MTRTGNSRNIFSEQNFQNFKNLFKICIEIYISVLPEGLASVLFAQGVGYNEITPYSTKNISLVIQPVIVWLPEKNGSSGTLVENALR